MKIEGYKFICVVCVCVCVCGCVRVGVRVRVCVCVCSTRMDMFYSPNALAFYDTKF
jgi:hypothetical protein